MKIYIMTDLEGPAMVYRFKQTRGEDPDLKRQAMELLTGEVNTAVDGILDAEPDAEVVVWDGHGNGGIDIMNLHPRAKFINRAPIKPPYFLDSSYDALFFVGQHAMAGTENAPLCHTYSSKTIEYYTLTGEFVGEFGCRAAMAGSLSVPTVFISGDDKAVAEGRALVPGIHGAVVKQGLGLELAMHLSPQAARELTHKVACEAVRDIGNIPPLKIDPPYEQEIRVREGVDIAPYLEKDIAEQLDERTVVLRSEDICELAV